RAARARGPPRGLDDFRERCFGRSRGGLEMRALREAWLVGYVRTPFGKADPKRGHFRNVRSDDLAAIVLGEACDRTGLDPGDVDGVLLGAVEMMGEQAHPGTTVPFLAGFPSHVTGLSIERACTTA